MKLTVVIISVFTICESIRVPTSWTNSDLEVSKTKLKSRPTVSASTLHHSESTHQPQRHQPLRYSPNFTRIKYPQTRYKNRPYNYQKFNANYFNNPPKNHNFASPISRGGKVEDANDWIPIVPKDHQYLQRTNLVKPEWNKFPQREEYEFDSKFNVLNKNYRDDKTHEPRSSYESYDAESVPVVERGESEKGPVSEHEVPLEVPTKPVYPGEGLWAKRGRKYKPFVSRHKYAQLRDESDEKPEGYEVFRGAEKVFKRQRAKHAKNLDEFPEKHELGRYIEPSSDQNEGDESEDNAEYEFVPMQLYSQVRRTENEEHLPQEDASDEKLREIIKDSKIQTVYTEEGYEDIAYDHAGHEKKAEEDEGFAEFDKEIEKEKERKVPKDLYKLVIPGEDGEKEGSNEIKNIQDSEIGESNHKTAKLSGRINDNKVQSPNTKMNKNNFIKTKETKTMAVKQNADGNMEMEISSEVKVVATPNNGTKAHKYVKIFPKRVVITKLDSSEETASLHNAENITSISDLDSTTSSILTLPPSTELPDLVTVEIPIPSSSTPAITKVPVQTEKPEIETAESVLSKINQAFLKVNPEKVLRRQKRFKIDYPEIETDTDFIDDIKDIPQLKEIDTTKEKYPYYESDINPDSPLRYSENLENIPRKTGGNMAFYEQADRTDCSEVETEIDPIPERVKNAERGAENMEETTDVAELAESPRLGKLGDKIECFKKKYFGENPLDSPIFSEEVIDPVTPIFKSNKIVATTEKSQRIIQTTQKITRENRSKPSTTEKYSVTNIRNEYINEAPTTEKVDVTRTENTRVEGERKTEAKIVTFSEEQTDQNGYEPTTDKTEQDQDDHNLNIGLNILTDVINKMDINTNTVAKNEEVQNVPKSPEDVEIINIETLPEPTEVPMINLITTPKYTIDLKPKHIYDQIELLQYLPLMNNSATQYENYTLINNGSSVEAMERIGRVLDLEKNNTEVSSTTTTSTTTTSTVAPNENAVEITEISELPESQALKKKRRRIVRPRRPVFQIFDINRYIPTTPFPYLRPINYNMPSPKYKVFSEVHYKDEIKPNEQLNVFADVINNIKNSSAKDPLLVSASQDNAQIAVKLNTFIPNNYNKNRFMKPPRNFYPVVFDHTYLNNLEETNSFYLTTSTTTLRPIVAQTMKTLHASHKNNNNLYKDLMVTVNGEDDVSEEEIEAQEIDEYAHKELEKVKKNRKPIMKIPSSLRKGVKVFHATSTLAYDNDKSGSEVADNSDYIEEPVIDVVGLVPPDNKYRTIYSRQPIIKSPNSVYSVVEEPQMNNFYVPGMKPPPLNKKALLYSDFKLENVNKVRRKLGGPIRRRAKRSPEKGYSEINRGRGPQFQGESSNTKASEEDDYVPHRPKNYHYDEKTGRIVYDNTKKEEPEELEEYVEVYEEETERPSISSKKSKTTTTTSIPWIATITTDKDEPSLLFYLDKLRKDPNYKLIPDPTTTEKGKEGEQTTEKVEIVTAQTSSTNAPEFLNILSKVRSDSHYKLIQDPKSTKATTTTEAPVIEDEEEEEVIEESKLENVQNSPGGQVLERGQNLDVFDINDFLPKVKNYQPRTSIDYSKYKTIERPTVRHNLSSRYNSDDQPLDEVNTKRVPIINERQQVMDDRNFDVNESPESSPPTSSTTEQILLSRRPTTTTAASTTPEIVEIANTTPSRFRNRQRKRPQTTPRVTTPRPTRRTTSQTPEVGNNSFETIQIDKAKRVYPRRRPARIKVRTTTEHYEETDDDSTKIVRRRHQTETTIVNNNNENVPSNHKPRFTPIVVRDKIDEDLLLSNSKPHDQFKRTAKIQTPDEFKVQSNLSEQISKPGKIEPRKIDVDVFKSYDKSKKHGGNYKKVMVNGNSEENFERLTDVVPKPVAFYTDPKLAKNVNQLKERDSEEIEEVSEDDNVGAEDVDGDNVENVEDNSNDYYDEVRINFSKKPVGEESTSESPTTTLQPVIFIKDPSRRLYYYASV